ncbi:hypothetical protein SDC9_140916 [bioreactor metagenome]|uniref:Uncharacterized protein n=1 Tax=bioreactor metagenome TaxID=1076179 RepID=A0A645DW79_9ZZZZ
MAQAHERALGEWQAEVAHWAALWQHTTAACRSLNLAAQGMVVVTKRMRRNVDGMQEVIFSEGFVQVLKPVLGSAKATALVAQQSEVALAEGRPLGALLQSAVEPLCAPDQWTRVRDAIAEVADLGCSVRASEQACQALLTQYAQPS